MAFVKVIYQIINSDRKHTAKIALKQAPLERHPFWELSASQKHVMKHYHRCRRRLGNVRPWGPRVKLGPGAFYRDSNTKMFKRLEALAKPGSIMWNAGFSNPEGHDNGNS